MQKKIFTPNLTPANILGLGWAATPAGLQGMNALADMEKERREGKAPGRSQKPAAIVGAGIVATAVSTVVAVVYCKVKAGRGD